jgi:hypothetical protein
MSKIVNISSNASGKGLKEDLEKEARNRGMKIRSFIGLLYSYAVNNKGKFKPLKNAREKDGANIGASVSEELKQKLDEWATKKQTSRGLLCCYILEKILEENLFDDIQF